MLDPLHGLGNELMMLIERGHYFVIHAARQSGKTEVKQTGKKITFFGC